jgi:type II secretory pathway component PulF
MNLKQLSQIQLFANVSQLEVLLFTKHLAVMIKSGILISEALAILIAQTKSPAFKQVLKSVLDDVENGQNLSKALKKYPKIFDLFYISMIEIGEDSGTLEVNLHYLVEQQEKENKLRKKIKGAMLYPTLVLSAAFIMGGAISIFVLPKMLEFFESFDAKLPLPTLILLWIANVMEHYGLYIFGSIIALVILFRFLITLPKIRYKWQAFLLSMPVIGPFIQSGQLAALCRNTGLMLKSGLTIIAALENETKATENLIFREYLTNIQNAVHRGKPIESELSSGKYKRIPPIVTKMIGIGEKTGKLDEVLLYLGDFFEEEVDDSAKNFSNVLEPILLLGIGLVIAFIALAIIGPIYELTGSVKR